MAPRIEDTLPPLRLIRAVPLTCSEISAPSPTPSPAPTYADFLERQNTIDRRIDDPAIPYSDYLRSLPARPKLAAPQSERPGCPRSNPGPCPPDPAPTIGLKLGDIPPTPAIRREIEVRTTYRVEVPLTSGRLIDVVM